MSSLTSFFSYFGFPKLVKLVFVGAFSSCFITLVVGIFISKSLLIVFLIFSLSSSDKTTSISISNPLFSKYSVILGIYFSIVAFSNSCAALIKYFSSSNARLSSNISSNDFSFFNSPIIFLYSFNSLSLSISSTIIYKYIS